MTVNKTTKSVGITWSSPNNLLIGGIRYYVALARNSIESSGEVLAKNTTDLEIKDLIGYTEYDVGVLAVNGDGVPFKSADVLVMTDERGE